LWKVIVRRLKKHPAPIDIYEESDMIIRTIRDIFTGDVDTIYIDEPKAHDRAKEFLQIVMPRYVISAATASAASTVRPTVIEREAANVKSPCSKTSAGYLKKNLNSQPIRGLHGGHSTGAGEKI